MKLGKEVAMKALVKNGGIELQEPMPEDWMDGTELNVDKADSPTAQSDSTKLDQWFAELEAGCSKLDPADDRILKDALAEIRRQEKELARKQAELEG
jgi:hypothetical protein